MSSSKPRVSIGMPVYNGEQFLRDALDSILAQTFEDFELIISDNASTDRTEEICRIYAARDRRIYYHRNAQNLGAAPNYNRVFELAKGEYFKWAAHDDTCAPEYLEQCVEVLNIDPSVVLSHSRTVLIDEDGQKIPFSATEDCFVHKSGKLIRKHDALRNFGSGKPHERYRAVLFATRWCFEVFGLMRTDALKRTSLIGPYYGSDKVLLAELSLMGRFVEIPQALFFRRCRAEQSSALGSGREREVWINPGAAQRFIFPRLVCFSGYLRAILQPQLSWYERTSCFAILARWLAKSDNWLRLISEAYREKLNRPFPRRVL